jgi:hypothetical protein
MATPADRFRLAPVSSDAVSIPVDQVEDHPGQWVLRVASNGVTVLGRATMANVILREDEDLTLATLRDRVGASWVVALCPRNDSDPAQRRAVDRARRGSSRGSRPNP